MISRLHSAIKKTPDILLALATSTLVVCIFLGWYIFSFRYFSHELKRLSLETVQLYKRLTSLKKRSAKYPKTYEQLQELQEFLEKESAQAPQTLFKAERLLLSLIKKNSMHLVQWKPGKKEVHTVSFSRLISCELEGSYIDFIAFLKNAEKVFFLPSYTLTKTQQGLVFKGEVIIFSRRKK